MKCRELGVGDRGQRFEVHYINREDGKDTIFGWTNTEEGRDRMMSAIAQWPAAKGSYWIDRETGDRSELEEPCRR